MGKSPEFIISQSLADLQDIDLPQNDQRLIFDLWAKYEDIAMHFNGLALNLRVKSLGTLGVFSTVTVAFQSGKEDQSIFTDYFLLMLLIGWVAIWVIDVKYYSKLLTGAVHAIRQLEHKSEFIKLSTIVEKRAEDPITKVHIFYGLPAIFLFSALIHIPLKQSIVTVFVPTAVLFATVFLCLKARKRNCREQESSSEY
jgi:hypothetical protein